MKYAVTLLTLSLLTPPQDETERQARKLVDQLRSEGVDERAVAEQELRNLGLRALPALEKGARDPDSEVAARAKHLIRVIRLLKRLPEGLVRTFPDLPDRMAGTSDQPWTEAFLAASSRIVGKPFYRDARAEDLDFLATRALRGAETAEKKVEVIERMEEWALPSGARALAPLLTSPESRLSMRASDALINLSARDVTSDVIPILQNEQQAYRMRAVRLLGELGSRNAIRPLLLALHDPNSLVREQAAISLGKLQAKEAVPELLRRLNTPSNNRGGVCEALGRIGDPSAIPALVRTISVDSPRPSHRACDALAKLEARQAIPVLVAAFESGNTNFRSAIARALGRLGGG